MDRRRLRLHCTTRMKINLCKIQLWPPDLCVCIENFDLLVGDGQVHLRAGLLLAFWGLGTRQQKRKKVGSEQGKTSRNKYTITMPTCPLHCSEERVTSQGDNHPCNVIVITLQIYQGCDVTYFLWKYFSGEKICIVLHDAACASYWIELLMGKHFGGSRLHPLTMW